MKKIIVVLMISMLFMVILVPPKADAIGISGSSALKNAVINSMEMTGVKFANKEAREKAYDAWNMKAYEKWKDDELNGRNQELWDSFIQETQRIETMPIETIPDKPGFGKMLLESTWFGMAISIGAEAGFAIEEAQELQTQMRYLGNGYFEEDGIDYSPRINHTREIVQTSSGRYNLLITLNGTTKIIAQGTVNGPGTFAITGYFIRNGMLVLETRVERYYVETGTVKVDYAEYAVSPSALNVDNGYSAIPKIEEVPQINPNPHVAPLIVPNPAIETVPQIIPQTQPVPVIVPIEPLTDNPYVEPYIPPGTDPGTDPGKPPGTNPGTDPGKPIIPQPGTDTPPYEKPDINPNPEETPEYPEDTPATDTPSLFGKLWEWLKAILDVLFKILNAILQLPFVLLELLWDFLWDLIKAVFVPSEDFWDTNMNELKKVIWSDEIDEMVDDFKDMGNGSGGMFSDIIVSLMGVDGLVVIDSDSINSILENIHKWVRGVVYPFLILFNINSLYKLIRGTSLVEATRGLAARQKGGE